MKTILNKFNGEPYIIHLPGDGMNDFYHYISFLEDKEITFNENIYILFICTPNIDSPLERQLIKNNIPYTNLLSYVEKEINTYKKWNWMYKHIALKRFLKCASEGQIKGVSKKTYFIVLDASDVIINRLDDIVKTYHTYFNQKVVFCGTKSDYPNECFYNKNYKQTPTVKSNFCVYINNGCIMTNFDLLKKITDEILQCNKTGLCGNFILNHVLIDDDQYICKIMQKRMILGYGKIKTDDMCILFQSASAGTYITETEDTIIID